MKTIHEFYILAFRSGLKVHYRIAIDYPNPSDELRAHYTTAEKATDAVFNAIGNDRRLMIRKQIDADGSAHYWRLPDEKPITAGIGVEPSCEGYRAPWRGLEPTAPTGNKSFDVCRISSERGEAFCVLFDDDTVLPQPYATVRDAEQAATAHLGTSYKQYMVKHWNFRNGFMSYIFTP
jgi:hypothetical protein